MLTLEDCLNACELTEAEVLAIAEHEHLPVMLAATYGRHLLHCDHGLETIAQFMRDDIAAAQSHHDLRHAAALKLVLKHFVESHMAGLSPSPEALKAELSKARAQARRTT